MTMLQSLAAAYDRLSGQGAVPPFGYSRENIGYIIVLGPGGTVVGNPVVYGQTTGGRHRPGQLLLPQARPRTAGVAPNFLWDRSSYVLGLAGGLSELPPELQARRRRRVVTEHAAFVEFHRRVLARADDAALQSLLSFLSGWTPEMFGLLGWPPEMLDHNIAFAFETAEGAYLQDRPEARRIWAEVSANDAGTPRTCLVTGQTAPPVRLHPQAKGVPGALTSGASLVSFNQDAFSSYGHERGENAPVSAAAAFAYGTALNHLLRRSPEGLAPNRVQFGDMCLVFWAEALVPALAATAERCFAAIFGADELSDELVSGPVGATVSAITGGAAVEPDTLGAFSQVRFNILGLAPNTARLSVRLWVQDSFDTVMSRIAIFCRENRAPAIKTGLLQLRPWTLLLETAAMGDARNLSSQLATEWLRSILTGSAYPQTLLTSLMVRIRADGVVNARRAGILNAVLSRNYGVSFDRNGEPDGANRLRAYRLGQLFAVYAGIEDDAPGSPQYPSASQKHFAVTAAQPRRSFANLARRTADQLAALARRDPERRKHHERLLEGALDRIGADHDPIPQYLSIEGQALFGLGYGQNRERQRARTLASPTSQEIHP